MFYCSRKTSVDRTKSAANNWPREILMKSSNVKSAGNNLLWVGDFTRECGKLFDGFAL